MLHSKCRYTHSLFCIGQSNVVPMGEWRGDNRFLDYWYHKLPSRQLTQHYIVVLYTNVFCQQRSETTWLLCWQDFPERKDLIKADTQNMCDDTQLSHCSFNSTARMLLHPRLKSVKQSFVFATQLRCITVTIIRPFTVVVRSWLMRANVDNMLTDSPLTTNHISKSKFFTQSLILRKYVW